MADMPKQWKRKAEGKARPKLRYGKKNGRKILGSEIRTAGHRVDHYCCVDFPECIDPLIRPGETYTREVWLYWHTLLDGTVLSYIHVTKTHEDPPCCADSEIAEIEREIFEEDRAAEEALNRDVA